MWRLTASALEDLDVISIWGLEKFGLQQAKKYDQRLLNIFDLLAQNPEMAVERQGARRRLRLMPCGSHHIAYAVKDGDVVILRVLHHLQDWFELV